MILRHLVLACLLLFASLSARAEPLPVVDDLSRDAAQARQQGAMIILVASLPDCFFCEYVKTSHLEPMVRRGELDGVALVREIKLDGDYITDFDGTSVDPADVARRYNGNFSPTVMFLGSNGSPLRPPLVGVQSRDFYAFYLEKAIASARESLPRPVAD